MDKWSLVVPQVNVSARLNTSTYGMTDPHPGADILTSVCVIGLTPVDFFHNLYYLIVNFFLTLQIYYKKSKKTNLI